MASNSSRVIPDQLKKLLDILGEEGALVNGRVNYAETSKQKFWKNVAQQLNSVEGGVYKNTWKWCKTWSDWKNNTKRKANILLKKKNYGGHYTYNARTVLSKLEVRLLKIIGYPLDEKTIDNALSEVDDSNKDIPIEYSNTPYSRLPHKSERFSSDDEDNTALSGVAKNNIFLCSSEDILQDEKLDYDNQSDAEDDLLNLTLKDPITKKRKMSLEEYKIKTQYAIQKERSHHKSEELRLKALELKLKGDELKLKETEMNKINYLTNIEEEKLKYFKEISANLKELLERSRNGNNRFHNVM